MAYNTGNPLGSTDARDLADNAVNFDSAVNSLAVTWIDRLGVTRSTFEGAVSGLTFFNVGDFATGFTLTNSRQTLTYSGHEYGWDGLFPKLVVAGSSPTPLGAGGWIDRTDLTIRSDLASSDGSDLIGFSHSTTASADTVCEKLKQVVSIIDAPFNATPGVDSTAAIDAASAAAEFVFVPEGHFISSNSSLEYWKFFGFGTLTYGNRTVEVSPSPQTGATGKYYKEQTFGNYENAVAFSAVANSGSGQEKENTQIEGTDAQGVAASYQSFDHGGAYFAATNFQSIATTGASTTYTATTITAPEISESSVLPGTFVWVADVTGYVGQVEGVSGTTATVVAWYIWGTGAASTPPNGTSAWINPNTKIWAMNANLFLSNSGMATSGTGIELGLFADKTGSGANITGVDVATLSGEEVAFMYKARGLNSVGYKAELSSSRCFQAENNPALSGDRVSFGSSGGKVGFLSQNDSVGIRIDDSIGASQEVVSSGVAQHSITGTGAQSRARKAISTYGASSTIGDDITVAVLTGTPVSLPAALRGDGRELIVTNQTGGNVTLDGNGHTISGSASVVIPSLGKLILYELGGNWIS